MKTKLLLIMLLLFSQGCIQRDHTIMNRKRPHQLAKDQLVYIQLEREDGTKVGQWVEAREGDYVFASEVFPSWLFVKEAP